MSKFKHILVPVDFGEPSIAALDMAIDLAKSFGAELTVMHAWELPVTAYSYGAAVYSSVDLITPLREAAENQLESTMTNVRARLPGAKALLRNGHIWSEIQEAIRETGADLVVMGTHGRSGLDHLLLGSVAERTVRSSPVPVLIARPRASAPRKREAA